MKGRTYEEAKQELEKSGASASAMSTLDHRVFKGNRPSNSVLFQKLTPYMLGVLVGEKFTFN